MHNRYSNGDKNQQAPVGFTLRVIVSARQPHFQIGMPPLCSVAPDVIHRSLMKGCVPAGRVPLAFLIKPLACLGHPVTSLPVSAYRRGHRPPCCTLREAKAGDRSAIPPERSHGQIRTDQRKKKKGSDGREEDHSAIYRVPAAKREDDDDGSCIGDQPHEHQ